MLEKELDNRKAEVNRLDNEVRVHLDLSSVPIGTQIILYESLNSI